MEEKQRGFEVKGRERNDEDLDNSLWMKRFESRLKYFGAFADWWVDKELKEKHGVSMDDVDENYRMATSDSHLPFHLYVLASDKEEAMEKLEERTKKSSELFTVSACQKKER